MHVNYGTNDGKTKYIFRKVNETALDFINMFQVYHHHIKRRLHLNKKAAGICKCKSITI